MTYEKDTVTCALCVRADRQLQAALLYLARDPEMAKVWIVAARATLASIPAGEPERPFRKLALVQAPPKEPPALTAKEEREAEIERKYLSATEQPEDPQ